MLKAGHRKIKRYLIEDLEMITKRKGENAYYFAEEWITDEETAQDGDKTLKLAPIEKWWQSKQVSIDW